MVSVSLFSHFRFSNLDSLFYFLAVYILSLVALPIPSYPILSYPISVPVIIALNRIKSPILLSLNNPLHVFNYAASLFVDFHSFKCFRREVI
jgi:hypothetical protein